MTIPPGMNFPPHWQMYVGVDSLDDAIKQVGTFTVPVRLHRQVTADVSLQVVAASE